MGIMYASGVVGVNDCVCVCVCAQMCNYTPGNVTQYYTIFSTKQLRFCGDNANFELCVCVCVWGGGDGRVKSGYVFELFVNEGMCMSVCV